MLARVVGKPPIFPYTESGGLLPVTPRLVERAAPICFFTANRLLCTAELRRIRHLGYRPTNSNSDSVQIPEWVFAVDLSRGTFLSTRPLIRTLRS